MRLGKVRFVIDYVVDLDNSEQVKKATGLIVKDIDYAIKYNEIEAYFTMIEDVNLSKKDIPEFLLGTDIENGDVNDD